MRTAVVRVDVDPGAELSPARLAEGMEELAALSETAGAELIEADLGAMPAGRRLVELLITGDEVEQLTSSAIAMCAKAFGTQPVSGVVTFVSRGTDDDAAGVLAGMGLAGEIERVPGDEGWDVIMVTLRKADLERVPESRVHTALEASLNCEVLIRTV